MFNLKNYNNIYMIGIGGVSMSGLAHILKSWNFNVSGSDRESSNSTELLEHSGIKVNIGQIYENISSDIDLIVYTAAIKSDNPELMHARELNIKTLERGEFLGELTKLFDNTIGIAGTHGKTTTTSMVSLCFLNANTDPTIQVGSELKNINGNYRVGKSDTFIIEACEYCDSFLNFKQKSAIVLNIDNDHLDYFKNLDNIKKSFKEYVSHLPKDGVLVINGEDANSNFLSNCTKAEVLKFGFNKDLDYNAQNIKFNDMGYPSYDLYNKDKFVDKIELNVLGIHNVLNSLACISLCLFYNLDLESIKKGLKDFTGAARRFEFKGIFNEAKVYDDYGHHPTEVNAVSNSIQNKIFNKSWVIFEPHTFSRVYNHASDFAKALVNFDNIIITDIYAAREKNTFGVSPNTIIEELKKINKEAIYISDYNEILKYLSERVQKDDLILTLGAGYITKLSNLLIEKR